MSKNNSKLHFYLHEAWSIIIGKFFNCKYDPCDKHVWRNISLFFINLGWWIKRRYAIHFCIGLILILLLSNVLHNIIERSSSWNFCSEGVFFVFIAGIFSLLGFLIAFDVKQTLLSFYGSAQGIITEIYDHINNARHSIHLYSISPLPGLASAPHIFNERFSEFYAKLCSFAENDEKELILRYCNNIPDYYYRINVDFKKLRSVKLNNNDFPLNNITDIENLMQFMRRNLHNKNNNSIGKPIKKDSNINFLIVDDEVIILFGVASKENPSLGGFVSRDQMLINTFKAILYQKRI